MATYTAPNYPSELSVGDIINFPYVGEIQTFVLPEEATLCLEVWGAEGGNRSTSAYGGKGGYSKGNITIGKGESLAVYVGGKGDATAKGWNGGGAAGYSGIYGGGATDVRLGGINLANRVIVAGGGGSVGAANKPGGAGGGTDGQSRTESYGSGGQGGTQTAGGAGGGSTTAGSLGQGGNGIAYANGYGGAGGGGYYGGAGTYPDGSGDDDRGGGGGSGYVGGVNNATTILGTNSMPSPTSSTEQVGQSGNGYARITVLETMKPVDIKEGDTFTFDFTGSAKVFNTNKEATILVEVWGAEGGSRTTSGYGGKGGYAKGEITIQKEDPLIISVGGKGDATSKGWNGGGVAGYANVYGGGATDVRRGGSDLAHRIIVAGGGGSVGAANRSGGAGGGLSGGDYVGSGYGTGGQGGTQTAGGSGHTSYPLTSGSLGQGGRGYAYASGYGGAGGGGYYGGAGVYPDGSGDDDKGGGGGSGYISSTLSNTALIAGTDNMPSPSNGTQVGQSGNGYCKITILSVKAATAAVKIKIGAEWKTSNAIKVRKNNEWIDAKAIKVFRNGMWEDAKN